MRHKHADVIIAWAEGKPVQCWSDGRKIWIDVEGWEAPSWLDDFEYRVKPQEVVDYTAVDTDNVPAGAFFDSIAQVDESIYFEKQFYLPNTYLQRTTIDGKVVDFKLIRKED